MVGCVRGCHSRFWAQIETTERLLRPRDVMSRIRLRVQGECLFHMGGGGLAIARVVLRDRGVLKCTSQCQRAGTRGEVPQRRPEGLQVTGVQSRGMLSSAGDRRDAGIAVRQPLEGTDDGLRGRY